MSEQDQIVTVACTREKWLALYKSLYRMNLYSGGMRGVLANQALNDIASALNLTPEEHEALANPRPRVVARTPP